MSEPMTIQDDQELQEARGAVRDTARALAAAETTRLEMEKKAGVTAGVISLDFAILQARQEEREARAVHDAATQAVEAARERARARVLAAWQPEDHARLRRLAEVAEVALQEAAEYRRFQEARAAAVGGVAGDHPTPQLLGLRIAIDRARARLDGPRAAAPAPREPMIKFLAPVFDVENSQHRLKGDRARAAAFSPETLKDMTRRGLVEPVA
jgi:hypothetical protein